MNWWDSLRRINFLQFSYRELTETEEPRKRIQSCNCVQPREDQTAWMRIYTAKNTANQDRPHTSEWPPEITGSPRWSLAPEIRIYTPRHKRPRCFVGHGQPGKRIERASERASERMSDGERSSPTPGSRPWRCRRDPARRPSCSPKLAKGTWRGRARPDRRSGEWRGHLLRLRPLRCGVADEKGGDEDRGDVYTHQFVGWPPILLAGL